jgi:2-dehydropantoate 2-reductase
LHALSWFSHRFKGLRAVTILVIGAGVIGTTYGWALSEAGHRVVHFVRPGNAARYSDGIPIDVFDRRKGRKRYFRGEYRLTVTESISQTDAYSLVIVPTKHYHLKAALDQLVPDLREADFLLLTQNWRGTQEIDALLPRTRFVFGDAKAGGTYRDGTLVATISSVDLGPPEGISNPLAEKCAALFESARIPARRHKDMLHYLWVQYAITAGLWPSLVRAGSMASVLRDPRACQAAIGAVRECLEVVSRRGVDLGDYPETRAFLSSSSLSRWIGLWMYKLALRYSEYAKRSSAHALDDPREIRAFYDDLVATGHELGVPMPVMSSYADDIASYAGWVR